MTDDELHRTEIGDWWTQRKIRGMALSQAKQTGERIRAAKKNVKHQSLPLTVCTPRQAAPARTPSAERWFVAGAQTWHLWCSVVP